MEHESHLARDIRRRAGVSPFAPGAGVRRLSRSRGQAREPIGFRACRRRVVPGHRAGSTNRLRLRRASGRHTAAGRLAGERGAAAGGGGLITGFFTPGVDPTSSTPRACGRIFWLVVQKRATLRVRTKGTGSMPDDVALDPPLDARRFRPTICGSAVQEPGGAGDG